MPDLPPAPDLAPDIAPGRSPDAVPSGLTPGSGARDRDRILAALRGLLRRVAVAGCPVSGLAAEGSPGADRLRDAVNRLVAMGNTIEDAATLLALARAAPRVPEAAAALRDSPTFRTARGDPGALPTAELATLLRGFREARRAGIVPPDPSAEAALRDALLVHLCPSGDASGVLPTVGAGAWDVLSLATTLLVLEDSPRVLDRPVG